MAGPARKCQRFFLPKRGHGADEYEDFGGCDPERGRFAIADGAAESSFAGLWANLLVEGFLQTATDPVVLSAWLGPVQERWAREIGDGPFPWFTETKIKEGAFSSFLGLVLEEAGTRRRKRRSWRAIAVGDSCLFQVRKGKLLERFPLHASAEFDNSPWLLGSRNSLAEDLKRKQREVSGTLRPKDAFFLMTDALACWFLKSVEAGQMPWEKLVSFPPGADGAQAFAVWIEELRNAGQLRNDDVTLLAVCL